MIKFLKKEFILTFHQDQLDRYGGKPGVRDDKLLESVLAQHKAPSIGGGEYVHENLFQMAVAYVFHLCKNHPFYDGNKRKALIAMYTFLYVNGYQIMADKKSLFAVMMDLANGKVKKDEFSEYFKTTPERELNRGFDCWLHNGLSNNRRC